jgi:hypothetical protein
VDLDQLDEAVDAEVGESHDALVFERLDPDYAVFRVHFYGDVEEEAGVFAEFLLATRSMVRTWETLWTCMGHAASAAAA